MQDIPIAKIDDIVDRIIPLTVLRRKPGAIFKKLEETGGFIITKDGKPLGKLLPLGRRGTEVSTKEKLRKLKKIIGGFHLKITLTPRQVNKLIEKSYEEMLSR